MTRRIDFGIDRLVDQRQLVQRLRAKRVGVLTHAASVNRELVHLCDVLEELGIEPRLLFGPEHGFAATAQDMAEVADAESSSGPRIVSLYGDSLDDLVPKPSDLSDLELLIIDMCDVGSRYYTYVWTALIAVRAAAKLGVHCLILDRPNPIGGMLESVEGTTVEPGFSSFVGWEPVPIRHSLTLGEMVATHIQRDGLPLGPDGALSVVGVQGWNRTEHADQWDRPFVLPSPNMPTFDTALVYPGGCLLEGTNLSEGRGHTRPFELFGAPFIDGKRLAQGLSELNMGGFTARPLQFEPTFHKHGKNVCGGVQIHVTDRSRFSPVATYVAAITLAHHQAPDAFAFRTERYEFVDDIPAFDLLTGSARARQAIVAGERADCVAESVRQQPKDWPERWHQARKDVERASWR